MSNFKPFKPRMPIQRTSAQIERIELDLVDYCNLKCPQCPTPQGGTKLNWNKIKPHLEYIATKNKIVDVTICGNGGEPTLHPEITNIILELSLIFPNALITLATNGENLKYLRLDLLEHLYKQFLIEFSVDGHTQKLHTMLRVGGNLNKVLFNIRQAIQHDIDTVVYTTRHLKNENEAEDIYNFILKETGIETQFRDTTRVSSQDSIWYPSIPSKNGNVQVLTKKNSIEPTYQQLEMVYNITPNFNFYFNPDGRVYPCAAFYYNNFLIPHLSAYDMEPEKFYEEFNNFSTEYCNYHRNNIFCDWKRCCLECGVDNSFKFDTIDDIRELYQK